MRTRVASAVTLLLCAAMLMSLPACSQSRPTVQSRHTLTTKPALSDEHNSSRWEKAIAAYEEMDRVHPPPRGAVLFIGSSTIRLWKTIEKDFPDQCVINRGFGGSQIVDATHFAERIVFPYQPRMVVLRSGGNDIHAGKTPGQVFADYKAFVAKVRARLPRTTVLYISQSPAPARWVERDANKTLNASVKRYTRGKPYLKYVETYDMVLGPDGQPRHELFRADGLHLSDEGYRLLADRVRPWLSK